MTKRGHHKIIIGASPGVGKTYRMLQEAHNMKNRGIDVVIGYFEPHDREETIALSKDLEHIPLHKIPYKSFTFYEMDTPAVIRRNPQVVLVDELAHHNAKDSKNTKRYEDVEEILNAGIDVISTLNIQHIESLNDIVARITGAQVNERIPDRILDEADEIVLVDISVEELQDRLKKGKIYSRDKIEQALNHFFKKGNLAALRELALREVANTVEEQAFEDPLFCPIDITGVHERVLVCISSHPNAQRLIRRGYRIAHGLSGDLFVLYVKQANKILPEQYKKSLMAHKQLTQQLEGYFLEIESRDTVETVVNVAKEHRITQIVVGESLKEASIFRFLHPEIPYQIFKKTSNIDVHIIATGCI